MNTLVHCIIFNISPQTQSVAWRKLEFGYEEGKMATKTEKLESRIVNLWLARILAQRIDDLGLDLCTEARWFGSNLLEVEWFFLFIFWSRYVGLIRVIRLVKKLRSCDGKGLVGSWELRLKVIGSKWLAGVLGLWYQEN